VPGVDSVTLGEFGERLLKVLEAPGQFAVSQFGNRDTALAVKMIDFVKPGSERIDKAKLTRVANHLTESRRLKGVNISTKTAEEAFNPLRNRQFTMPPIVFRQIMRSQTSQVNLDAVFLKTKGTRYRRALRIILAHSECWISTEY